MVSYQSCKNGSWNTKCQREPIEEEKNHGCHQCEYEEVMRSWVVWWWSNYHSWNLSGDLNMYIAQYSIYAWFSLPAI